MEPFFITIAFPGVTVRRLHIIAMVNARSCAEALDRFRPFIPRHPELASVRIEPVPFRLRPESKVVLDSRSWTSVPCGLAYGASDIVWKIRDWRREYKFTEEW